MQKNRKLMNKTDSTVSFGEFLGKVAAGKRNEF